MKIATPLLYLLFCYINSYAQVGIGTLYPEATLDVNGNLRVQSIDTDETSSNILILNSNNIVSQATIPRFFAVTKLTIPVCRTHDVGATGSFTTTVQGVTQNVTWEVLYKTKGTNIYPSKSQQLKVKYTFDPGFPYVPDGYNLTAFNDSNYPDTFTITYTDYDATSITVILTRNDIASSDEDNDCWAGQFYFDIMTYKY
ncbi:hypothetical protein ACG2LH_13300 [Zhouia sp. PK063]|uniref:hypothetical protein n=1 Tax=Zhouia sp. PK063 TaxID=3373602 RepID=UPI00379173E1